MVPSTLQTFLYRYQYFLQSSSIFEILEGDVCLERILEAVGQTLDGTTPLMSAVVSHRA